MSNPLRHLATLLLPLVKQKTTQNISNRAPSLTSCKYEGFRSIQASDNAASPSTTDSTIPLSSDVVPRDALCKLPERDLLPIELSEAITFKGPLVSHPDWDAMHLAVMWDYSVMNYMPRSTSLSAGADCATVLTT